MDCADHDFMGAGDNSFRACPQFETVLCGTFLPGDGRSELFPSHDRLFDSLDPPIRTRKGHCYLVRCNPFVRGHRVPIGGVAVGNWLARYRGVALAFYPGRDPSHPVGHLHSFLSYGLAARGKVARRGRARMDNQRTGVGKTGKEQNGPLHHLESVSRPTRSFAAGSLSFRQHQ